MSVRWHQDQIGQRIGISSDGHTAYVYYKQGNHASISCYGNYTIRRAYWSGEYVIIELSNGEKRRYSDSSSYGSVY